MASNADEARDGKDHPPGDALVARDAHFQRRPGVRGVHLRHDHEGGANEKDDLGHAGEGEDLDGGPNAQHGQQPRNPDEQDDRRHPKPAGPVPAHLGSEAGKNDSPHIHRDPGNTEHLVEGHHESREQRRRALGRRSCSIRPPRPDPWTGGRWLTSINISASAHRYERGRATSANAAPAVMNATTSQAGAIPARLWLTSPQTLTMLSSRCRGGSCMSWSPNEIKCLPALFLRSCQRQNRLPGVDGPRPGSVAESCCTDHPASRRVEWRWSTLGVAGRCASFRPGVPSPAPCDRCRVRPPGGWLQAQTTRPPHRGAAPPLLIATPRPESAMTVLTLRARRCRPPPCARGPVAATVWPARERARPQESRPASEPTRSDTPSACQDHSRPQFASKPLTRRCPGNIVRL